MLNRELKAGFDASAVRGLLPALDGPGDVGFAIEAGHLHDPELILGMRVARFGGAFEPARGRSSILLDAGATGVHGANQAIGWRVALLHRKLCPAQRLVLISRHSFALEI